MSAASAPGASSQRLRTVFCTRGGLFGALVLRQLRGCERLEVCAIVRSTRVLRPGAGWLRGVLALVRRCGLGYSLYLWCATSLTDLLCRFAPGGAVPVRTREVPVHVTADINDASGREFLRRCAPQLLVSAFFDQRLHPAALAIPGHGCVNVHPSLLPSFGGVDPVLRARTARAPLGVTVHWMTPGLDDGPILAQQAVQVAATASLLEATAVLFRAGAGLLVQSLDRIAARDPGVPQGAGSYQGWPTRSDVRALRAAGTALLRAADLRAAAVSG